MSLPIGSRLGPYEILAPLGAGGMGEVYEARDVRLNRTVAIKVLPESHNRSPIALDRFKREAQAAATLNHPNICTIYDVGADDLPYIAMERLEGESLQERLVRGPVDLQGVLGLGAEIADALELAHRAGIVHRDIKPANVFLTSRGAKILDFGLAKAPVGEQPRGEAVTGGDLTDAGSTVGTVAYMSPEQARGEPVGAASDLFSLGAVLYEMVTGERAFGGATTAVVFDAVLNHQPHPSPRSRPVPPALQRILTTLLAKDPRARYESAGELRNDLRAVSAGSAPRHAVAHDAAQASASIAVLPFVSMSGDADGQYFGDGLAEELINALTRLPGLNVSARTSAFRFRGHEVDIRDIGHQLNVETVLEGSVRRAGQRLRVTAQLIKVSNGYHLWSERYDREMADVFDVQDEIVAAIVGALAPTLLGETARAAERPTANIEAYELYLRGRALGHLRSPSGMRQAIACYEQAIVLDPDYALAFVGLAETYSLMRSYGWASLGATQGPAMAAMVRAASLAPSLPEVLFTQGQVTFYFERAWHRAEGHFRAVVAMHPRFSMPRAYLGMVLACAYRGDEAVAEAQAACELDPLSPLVHCLAAITANIAGRFEDGERASRRALELQPDVITGWWTLGLALLGQRRFDEAIAACQRALSLSRAPNYLGYLGLTLAAAGRTDDVTPLVRELDAQKLTDVYVPPYAPLCIQVGRASADDVCLALQACVADQTPPLSIQASCGPWLDRLRSDPRVDRLLDQLYDGIRPVGRSDRTPG